MKGDKEIVETYYKLIEEQSDTPPNIDELSPERQAWYRG